MQNTCPHCGYSPEITIPEACKKYSNLKRATLKVYLQNGHLRGRKQGRDWVFYESDLLSLPKLKSGRPIKIGE